MDKILVAEDDERLLYIVSKSLESAGYSTLTATNGKDAIEILNNNKDINLAIVDLIMPILSGLELCDYIRCNNDLSHIPILIITGQVDMFHKLKGFEAGADDYITKPIEFVEFMLRVKALLRRGNLLSEKKLTKNEENPNSIPLSDDEQQKLSKIDLITKAGETISIDYLTSSIFINNKREYLTSTEMDIFNYLLNKKSFPTDYKEILSKVLGYSDGKGNPVSVRTHIRNMRLKIEKNPDEPEILINIPKRGYILDLQILNKNTVKV